ncbi:MAG: ferrochelatase [Actinomycetota bacterium]|nr:ferrochelatase [Actinomycetota bacterium]
MGEETSYDALLLVAFGGPEGPDQVGPFLERVAAGRKVPSGRLAEVAARYERFGGVSPINGRMRSLAGAVSDELEARQHDLPVVWGNRNAAPLLADVVTSLRDAGAERVLAWVASPYSSYSTCRQYGEDLDNACRAVGAGAPRIDRIRPHHDHPGLIGPAADRLTEALDRIPVDRRTGAHLLFCAHSIPTALAETCGYVEQLRDAARLVAERVDPGCGHPWEVVWQSRSGSPDVPWLEPDVGDRIESLAAQGVRAVALSPLGLPVENFEIAWDLDLEAARRAEDAGVSFSRARAVDDDARFASMVVDLFEERLDPTSGRRSLGGLGLRPDSCPVDCCPAPGRP